MKRLLKWQIALLAALSLPSFCVAQTDAYRLFGNSIRVDRASHWENWIYQNDLVSQLNVSIGDADIFQVEADGLRPVFFRRNINVAPTAVDFTYPDLVRAGGDIVSGGATAKSNDVLANNIVDGDLSTFWEPNTPVSFANRVARPGDFHIDGLRNWEIEIDLGRLVFADSLTIIFPAGQFEDEFLGEPVKAFALFASMGERFPFPLGNKLQFSLIEEVSTGSGDVRGETGAGTLVSVPGTRGRYVQMTFPSRRWIEPTGTWMVCPTSVGPSSITSASKLRIRTSGAILPRCWRRGAPRLLKHCPKSSVCASSIRPDCCGCSSNLAGRYQSDAGRKIPNFTRREARPGPLL